MFYTGILMIKNPQTVRKTIYFTAASLVTGALYAALLFIFDSVLNLPFFISVSLSYISAMLFYFITNKLLTFNTVHDKNVITREVIQYILLVFVNYILTIMIVTVVSFFTGEIYSGSLLAGVITITLTFFVFDKLIFVSRSHK
jgi:putative flippase GtrA